MWPYRCNGRLFCRFISCTTESNADGECVHETFAEKSLTVTWVIDEVRLAVQTVYEVVEILELFEYGVTP